MTNFSVKNYASERLKNLCLNEVSLNFLANEQFLSLKIQSQSETVSLYIIDVLAKPSLKNQTWGASPLFYGYLSNSVDKKVQTYN